VTPFAFVIGSDGQVLAKGLCNGATRLSDLLKAGGLEAAAEAFDSLTRMPDVVTLSREKEGLTI
jgi:hypothetical protein